MFGGSSKNDLLSQYGGKQDDDLFSQYKTAEVGESSLMDQYSSDKKSPSGGGGSIYSQEASFMDDTNDMTDHFNVRGGNYGNMSIVDNLRGAQANRLDADTENVSIAEMYSDKSLDNRVAGGRYNNTISDVYGDKQLFNAYHGLNTDGHIDLDGDEHLMDTDAHNPHDGNESFILGTDLEGKEPGLFDQVEQGFDSYKSVGQEAPNYGAPSGMPPVGRSAMDQSLEGEIFGGGMGGSGMDVDMTPDPGMQVSNRAPSYARSSFGGSSSRAPNYGTPSAQAPTYEAESVMRGGGFGEASSGGFGEASSGGFGEASSADAPGESPFDSTRETSADSGRGQSYMDQHTSAPESAPEPTNVEILKQRLSNLKNSSNEGPSEGSMLDSAQSGAQPGQPGAQPGQPGAQPGQPGAAGVPMSPGDKAKAEKEAKKEIEKAIRDAEAESARIASLANEDQQYIDGSFGGQNNGDTEQSSTEGSGKKRKTSSLDQEKIIKEKTGHSTFNADIPGKEKCPLKNGCQTGFDIKQIVKAQEDKKKSDDADAKVLSSVGEGLTTTPFVQAALDSVKKIALPTDSAKKDVPPGFSEKNIPSSKTKKDSSEPEDKSSIQSSPNQVPDFIPQNDGNEKALDGILFGAVDKTLLPSDKEDLLKKSLESSAAPLKEEIKADPLEEKKEPKSADLAQLVGLAAVGAVAGKSSSATDSQIKDIFGPSGSSLQDSKGKENDFSGMNFGSKEAKMHKKDGVVDAIDESYQIERLLSLPEAESLEEAESRFAELESFSLASLRNFSTLLNRKDGRLFEKKALAKKILRAIQRKG